MTLSAVIFWNLVNDIDDIFIEKSSIICDWFVNEYLVRMSSVCLLRFIRVAQRPIFYIIIFVNKIIHFVSTSFTAKNTTSKLCVYVTIYQNALVGRSRNSKAKKRRRKTNLVIILRAWNWNELDWHDVHM